MIPTRLGLGAGWRPALAWAIEQRPDLGFVEIVAESFDPVTPPAELGRLAQRGVARVAHGVQLGLASAEPLEPGRIARLAAAADAIDATLVSEHIAFVRAGNLEAGHLLPPPRHPAALRVIIEHARRLTSELGRPIALENIAASFSWPDDRYSELDFLCEILEQTEVGLLLDVSNLVANVFNFGFDLEPWLDRLPWERVAYLHVGGGVMRHGHYVDTHAHPVPAHVFELLTEIATRHLPLGVMLERDDRFPAPQVWHDEMDRVRAAAALPITAITEARHG